MVGFEKGKVYQQATFVNGARVWNVPTNDIKLRFAEHEAPAGTSFLSCDQSMVVSSSRVAPDKPAEQNLVALGNGEFYNDTYRGFASKITYNGQDTIFEGSGDQMATFRKREVNDKAEETKGRTITYYKNGTIQGDGVGTGFLRP